MNSDKVLLLGPQQLQGQKFQGLRSSKPWEFEKRIRSRKFGILVPKFEQEIKRKNQLLLQALEPGEIRPFHVLHLPKPGIALSGSRFRT